MNPTVGRIVHYFTNHQPDQTERNGIGPYAAIVTGVGEDGAADLKIFGLSVEADRRFDVPELPAKATAPLGHYWAWPPRDGDAK